MQGSVGQHGDGKGGGEAEQLGRVDKVASS